MASSESSGNREIRVFLSSTFADMHAERDHLLGQVFPRLRHKAAERKVTLTDIDLRWGIREEDSRNGRTVELCLQEIDRCRRNPPFFIGFLGERYGWIPQREDLRQYWEERRDSPYARIIEEGLRGGGSVTELEMRHAFLGREVDPGHARVFLRSRELTEELWREQGGERSLFFEGVGGRLSGLKEQLRQRQEILAIDGYTSVEEFGEGVCRFLEEALDRLYPLSSVPAEEEEIREESQAVYAASRRKDYVPLVRMREEVREAVAAALNGEKPVRIFLGAPSGMGKSAFVADVRGWGPADLQVWVDAFYLGIGRARSLEDWRDHLLGRLRKGLEGKEEGSLAIPEKERDRWEYLPVALHRFRTSIRTPVLLLLDGLDQLRDAGGGLKQLENLFLPEGVVLLVSSTPVEVSDGWQVLELPGLERKLRGEAIEAYLGQFQKRIDESLLEEITGDQACENPLFLRLLLEELRLHGRFETLGERARKLLATRDAHGLWGTVLGEIDRDFGERDRLATRLGGLLAVSFLGLREQDLAYLLARGEDPSDPGTGRPRLPDAVLSALMGHLEAYCVNVNGRYLLFHAVLREGLLGSGEEVERRRELVGYFEGSEEREEVIERVYQRWRLGETAALIGDLGRLESLEALWEGDPLLLRDVLGDLGAGDGKPGSDTLRLVQLWREWPWTAEVAGRTNRIAGWFFDMAFHGLAEPLLTEALAIRRKALPGGHPDIARSLDNLAALYRAQGRKAGDLLENESELKE